MGGIKSGIDLWFLQLRGLLPWEHEQGIEAKKAPAGGQGGLGGTWFGS